MMVSDMTDLYNSDPNLLPLGLVGSFGVGLQTYSQKPVIKPFSVPKRSSSKVKVKF